METEWQLEDGRQMGAREVPNTPEANSQASPTRPLPPSSSVSEHPSPPQQEQQHILPVLQPNGCWKSTPGAGSHSHDQPPRLSVSAISPLSNLKQQQQLSMKMEYRRRSEDVSDCKWITIGSAAAAPTEPEPGLLRRFLSTPRVQRSLASDIAIVLVFIPLSIGASLALMRLFVRRVGEDQLEWHHYMLVAALGSLGLVPVIRLANSCKKYHKLICGMITASRGPKSMRRMGVKNALLTSGYTRTVAKKANIDLSRRGDLSAANNGPGGGSRSVSGISCHRNDISMAAYSMA